MLSKVLQPIRRLRSLTRSDLYQHVLMPQRYQSSFIPDFMAEIKAKNPGEEPFHQAVLEVVGTRSGTPPDLSKSEDSAAYHRARTRRDVSRALV